MQGEDTSANPKIMANLRSACRDMKHQLSNDNPVETTEDTLVPGTPIKLELKKKQCDYSLHIFKDTHMCNVSIWQNINNDEAVAFGEGLHACKLYGTRDICPGVFYHGYRFVDAPN